MSITATELKNRMKAAGQSFETILFTPDDKLGTYVHVVGASLKDGFGNTVYAKTRIWGRVTNFVDGVWQREAY